MKRRWKKFLAGVLSAALALNLAAPLALADSGGCTVAGRVLSGNVDSVTGEYIQGEVSYHDNILTFISDEVSLDTILASNLTPLVTAADGNNGLKLVANGTVIGNTKGDGFERPNVIDGGKYSLMNLDWHYSSTGILGVDTGTTITAGTTMKLDGFKTGIGGGDVQIDGKVTIKTTTYSGSPVECGIANSTTMNPGSELIIYAQRFIDKENGHLTYNGGHLLLNVTTIDGDFGLSKLSIGNDVRTFWYRTGKDETYTKATASENFENFTDAIGQNPAYLELKDEGTDQPESESYDLWVAGTQVTKTNQSDVLGDGGSVKFDPNTHTLTLNNANLTLGEDAEDGIYSCIDSDLTDMLTITGTATLSDADGIMTVGPLTLDNATLTLTGESGEGVEDAIRAGSQCDKDITIRNSTVTIADTNSEGNFFQYGIRCGKLIVENSTLNVKAYDSAIWVDELKASGAGTVITAETDSTVEDDYALELDKENSLTLKDGLVLVEGEVNKSRKAKIARPEQAPTGFKVYWVVHPGDDPVNGGVQFPGAIFGSEEEERLFEGWFLEDGTRLEDSRYYMGPGAKYVGNLDRDVTFYGHWRTAESGEGSEGGDGFGTLLAGGAVVGVAGVVAYQVGTELILDQLLPAGVAVPHTRAELAMLLWNTAGRPAPAALPAFADVADPELAQAAQWAIEQEYLKARADGSFQPDKGVAKWRVIRGYRAVTEP